MNHGRDGDGQEPADATHVTPSGGAGHRQRPGAPVGPPPPAESFRPVGPPPPAESFRPAGTPRPVPPTAPDRPSPGRPPTDTGAPTGAWPGGADVAGVPGVAGPPGAPQPADPTRAYPGAPGATGGTPYPMSGPAGPSGPYGQPGRSGPEGGAPAGPAAPDGTAKRPRRRRRRTTLILGLVVLLVLLVVADRVSVRIAKSEMRKKVVASVAESVEPGQTPPTVKNVSIGGFPFLTQVIFGKFKDIGVTIENIPTPGPKISEVDANLKGVHVPFGDAITDNVGSVPVDDVRATVIMSYADLNAFLAKQNVQINPVDGGEKVEITGIVDIPVVGAQKIGGVTTFQVRDNQLTLVPSGLELQGAINFGFNLGDLGSFLPPIPVPVSGLPFDLRIISAGTTATGLSLTATAKDVVLPAG